MSRLRQVLAGQDRPELHRSDRHDPPRCSRGGTPRGTPLSRVKHSGLDARVTATRPGAPAGAPQGHSAVARETRADLPVIDNSLINHYFLVFTISPSTTLRVLVGRSIGSRCATPPRSARLLAHQTPAPETSASVADRPEPADHALSSRCCISVSANTPFETSRRSAPAQQDACRWCSATGLLPPRSS